MLLTPPSALRQSSSHFCFSLKCWRKFYFHPKEIKNAPLCPVPGSLAEDLRVWGAQACGHLLTHPLSSPEWVAPYSGPCQRLWLVPTTLPHNCSLLLSAPPTTSASSLPSPSATWGPWSESRLVVSNSLQPHRLYNPWNSPGQNTRVGSLSLLQGILLTQGLNPGPPHCGWILYQMSHKGRHLRSTDMSYSGLKSQNLAQYLVYCRCSINGCW